MCSSMSTIHKVQSVANFYGFYIGIINIIMLNENKKLNCSIFQRIENRENALSVITRFENRILNVSFDPLHVICMGQLRLLVRKEKQYSDFKHSLHDLSKSELIA